MGLFSKKSDDEVKDYDPEIIAWHREDKGELETRLMHIFPKKGENIKEKKYFAVKDYEQALFFNKGELIGVLEGGVYELEKEGRIKGTEIIWIDTSILNIPWGIPIDPGIPTLDGYFIGLYGDLKIKISDILTFYNDVVAGYKDWKIQDLKEWILSLLTTSLRDIFKKYKAKKIILEERERVINLVISKLTEEFLIYGLELISFNILGLNTPHELETKEEIITEISKQDLEKLKDEKTKSLERINTLKSKLKSLQDQLIEGKISKKEFKEKEDQINLFIKKEQKELEKINITISDL